jgi:hypothetical protein
MRNVRCFAAIAALSVPVLVSAPARSELVAGWDFSQYLGSGTLVIDDGSLFDFVTTLSANYSTLDSTFNAGAESAAFGTMYIDGQFGSTAVAAGDPFEAFSPYAVPGTGSLLSNIDAPVFGFGDNEFDAHQLLQLEGQVNAQFLAMTALGDADVVFRADRGSPPPGGWKWILSFGANTQNGTSTVGIEFSTSGSGYTNVGFADLTTTDSRYELDLGPATEQTAFVRLSFQPELPNAPVLDNVAISVPEASGLASGVAALGALLAYRRLRA